MRDCVLVCRFRADCRLPGHYHRSGRFWSLRWCTRLGPLKFALTPNFPVSFSLSAMVSGGERNAVIAQSEDRDVVVHPNPCAVRPIVHNRLQVRAKSKRFPPLPNASGSRLQLVEITARTQASTSAPANSATRQHIRRSQTGKPVRESSQTGQDRGRWFQARQALCHPERVCRCAPDNHPPHKAPDEAPA